MSLTETGLTGCAPKSEASPTSILKYCASSGLRRRGAFTSPAIQALSQRLTPPYFSLEPPRSLQASVWSHNPSLLAVNCEPGFSKRRQRHVPIVITQSIVESVLKDLPDSPASLEYERRPSLPIILGSEKEQDSPGSKSVQRSRHVPIIIPAFAQPYGIFPPTPSSSQCNTPRATPPATFAPEPLFAIMSRPATNGSRTSTLDSNDSAPSPAQLYAGRFKPSSSTYLADMNSSHSSLDREASQESFQSPEPSPEPLRGAGSTPQSSGPSPAVAQQSQPANATTNLSGLVCNVHKCTGKEPHALIGATTSILGDKLYVFGGRILSRRRPQFTSDLYELDLIRRHWKKVDTTGDIPPPRYFHSVCTLGDTKLICYGGMSPASAPPNQNRNYTAQQQAGSSDPQPEVVVMSDIHIYDAPTRKWTYIPSADTPQGRYAHCATVLPSSATFSSANAPLSALHHNPPSSNPNQGTLGVVLDGTGGAEMVVVGGQDSANHYIEQISVFNLRSLKWTATQQLGRSCGAYRSVVAPLTSMPASRIGAGTDVKSKSMDPRDEGSSMLIYSNYNFLDVKLELQVRMSDGTMSEKPMHGQYSPPGLRFPNGGVLDNHFVVSGTYLTSSKQEYALWALDLRSLTWSRIDVGGSVFNQGSWNRGVLWSRRNTFVILGNRKRSLVDDYNHRRINFSNICMVELEAFGLYDNPRRVSPTSAYPSVSAPVLPPTLLPKSSAWSAGGRAHSAAASELGQKAMNLRELADMDILAISGERIPVNSHILARQWGPYFTQLLREGVDATSASLSTNDASSASDAATLRPHMSSQASRNSSITITPSIDTSYSATTNRNGPAGSSAISVNSLHPSTDTTNTTNTSNTFSSLPPDSLHLPPSSRPRTLYLPHTLLTLQALVHYLYTSSLPSSPLQFTDPAQPQTRPDLCTPQILCSLLQLARPYRVDGLLEAVVERLHQVLDGRNAAAVFNAAAMAAGGARGTRFAFGGLYDGIGGIRGEEVLEDGSAETSFAADGEGAATGMQRSRSLRQGLRINTSFGNDARGAREIAEGRKKDGDGTDTDGEGGSVAESESTSGSVTDSEYLESGPEEREVWSGEISCVVGLQKRGLRGLMEGRRMRERGKSAGPGTVGGWAKSVDGDGGGARVGLGIV
ncbi:hypothetical protein MMC08_006198 [Hypocenomyce scalaris]|nr:hypothetical protein [Hypocenomyce scalaris]